MGEEFVPQMEREIFVDAAQAGDEVIFERANCTFSGVAAVETRRHQLIVDVFVDKELFECRGALVVQTLEFWAQAGGDEASM